MNHCLTPISLGELFDKYSILEIKNERIRDENKRQIVQNEMNYLKPLIDAHNLDIDLWKTMKTVNEELWDIEERIREKEKTQSFDQEFIELARKVYITNDERCRVKNKINEYLHSDIKEIKSYV